MVRCAPDGKIIDGPLAGCRVTSVTLPANFARRLRDCGLKQTQIARACGCHQSFICKIVNGKCRVVSVEFSRKLWRVLQRAEARRAGPA